MDNKSGEFAVHLIVSSLIQSSKDHALRALSIYCATNEDDQNMAFHAALAVEHLTKAKLAKTHPVLLVPKGERVEDETLLFLCGLETIDVSRPSKIRTVGGHDACTRLGKIYDDFPYDGGVDQQLIFHHRNWAAHFGKIEFPRATECLSRCTRILQWLLDNMNVTVDLYWSDHKETVKSILENDNLSRRTRYEAKLEAAQRNRARRFESLDESSEKLVVSMLERQTTRAGEYVEQRNCPACHGSGSLRFKIMRGWDLDTDGRSMPSVSSVTAHPNIFECPICDLALTGTELEFPKLTEAVEIDQDDQELGYLYED